MFISFLFFHFGIIYRTTINSWRCASFHSSSFKPHCHKLFSNTFGSSFPGSTTPKFLFTYVNESIEKRTVGKDYRFCHYFQAQ